MRPAWAVILRSRQILFATVAFCLLHLSAIADEPFQPNIRPTLAVRRTSESIKIDARLDDPGWRGAARAVNFAEYNPKDMVKPPVETAALVTYDDTYLYLGFICQDDPRAIRASLRDRDETWQDDVVGIMLDTYGDGGWAYEIFCNPLGVQGDIRWTPNNEDISFDLIFESAGVITDSGYQLEIAIPFRNLRFPNSPAQTWRATFWRNHPRASRGQYSWAAINRDVSCFPCQWGTLTGIENVRPGRDFEILPALTGFQSSELRNSDFPDSGLSSGKVDGRLSLGVRYSLSSSASAEATWKPDFSQIESDVAQIDVNSTFALFYSEHRPFFQEGSDLFETPFQAVYTRSINDPLVAAKMVGRTRRLSIAYLGARDLHSPITLPLEERGEIIVGGKSTSNIVRAKHTFWEDSFVGALLTTRVLDDGGSGTVAGIDGSFRLQQNYNVRYQALASHSREPNDTSLTSGISQQYFDRGRHTVAFDGESYWGRALYAVLIHDARLWNFNVDYMEKDPEFRADNGFVVGNDVRRVEGWTGLIFRPDNTLLDQLIPNLTAARVWNFAGVRKDEWLIPDISILFKGQTTVEFNYLWSRERFHDIVFDGIRRFEVSVNSVFSDPLAFDFQIVHGRFIARNLDTPVLGAGTDIGFDATVKPWHRFVIEPSFSYSKLDYPGGGPMIFKEYVLRSRFKYQFTRELSLRLVLQYIHGEDQGSPLERHFDVEPLLSYKVNPFTIFYIGSTQAYQKNSFEQQMTRSASQYFLKFQYLINI